MKPAIHLTDIQRAKLRAVSNVKAAREGKDNPMLDLVIAELKQQNPQAFLRDDTLILRRFLHEPKFPIPHAGNIK